MTKEKAWKITKKKAFPYKSILTKEEERALDVMENIMLYQIRQEKKYREFQRKVRKAMES